MRDTLASFGQDISTLTTYSALRQEVTDTGSYQGIPVTITDAEETNLVFPIGPFSMALRHALFLERHAFFSDQSPFFLHKDGPFSWCESPFSFVTLAVVRDS